MRSATIVGVEAHPIDVETEVIGSLRRFAIVGLPDGVLREAKDRVRCALENSGFPFPHGEVVVNLSPAAIPKRGAGFDLAIALSVLAATGQIPPESLEEIIAYGELTLDGSMRSVGGELAVVAMSLSFQKSIVCMAKDTSALAACIPKARCYGISHLAQIVAHLRAVSPLLPVNASLPKNSVQCPLPGLGDVVGQEHAKRALEVVAAGGHNLLMVGPPGSGKSMLAERVPSLLPQLSLQQSLEVASIHSISSSTIKIEDGAFFRPPYRSPHHSTSVAGLVGGGAIPLPGEISLAHHGVLFLDEVAELRRDALEALRMPLENRCITISRSRLRIQFPADCIVVAAMNPCPCGRHSVGTVTTCRCSPGQRQRYFEKLSGPIRDRFDVQVWVPSLPVRELRQSDSADASELRCVRVSKARILQEQRGVRNAHLQGETLRKFCAIDTVSHQLLERAADKFTLSARGYTRVLRVARTLADLEQSENIRQEHVAEALAFRVNDF